MYRFTKNPVTGETIRRKDYPSERSYLEAVYKIHRTAIDEAFGAGAKETFIKRAQVIKGSKYRGKRVDSISKALDILGNRGKFYEQGRTNLENLFEGLKGSGAYKSFTARFRDEKGRFTKVQKLPENYEVREGKHYYRKPNGGFVVMDFSDSPYGVTMWEEDAAGNQTTEPIFYAYGEV